MGKFLKEHLTIVIVLLLSLGVVVSLPLVAGKNVTIPFVSVPTQTPLRPTGFAEQAPMITTFSYKGEDGKDALTILEEKTTIEQADSGLVTAINGSRADDKKHEFWAFYVNGTMATVGPADYQTKDTDTILWKIEKY